MNESSTALKPRLSVIVPVLNEQGTISSLLQNLAQQKGTLFELIICDGGSTDDTVGEVQRLATHLPFPTRIMNCGKGRGRQMNAGARVASADYLLFLHADSRFPDRDALAHALAKLSDASDHRIAGHFALTFSEESLSSPFWYYFHTCKARLHRPGCTHGDQGWLLHRSWFADIGPFDESLPFLEDARLAALIRKHGQWLLFDREIVTSSRRFESEGLHHRQALNALIMACHETGLESLLSEMPTLYRQQQETGSLALTPFISRFIALSATLPSVKRSHHWLAVGRFIADNAWQAAFLIDTRRRFNKRLPPGATSLPVLDFFDRHLTLLLKPLAFHLFLGLAARLALAALTFTGRHHSPK
jgi:rSAM/selenodomain-associated transferase 2